MPEPGPAVEYEARSRLGLAEADAFLARLGTLSFDITGPLGRLSGGVADVQAQLDIRGGRIELPPWGFAWLPGT